MEGHDRANVELNDFMWTGRAGRHRRPSALRVTSTTHASGSEEQLLQPLDRRLKDLFRGGVRFPIRPQSWDRLGHL